MTIRLRLALLFTLVTLGLLVLGGVLFVKRLNLELEASLDQTLTSRAGTIIGELGPPDRPIDARLRLSSANGIYAQLLTTRGEVLDGTRALSAEPLLRPDEAATAAHHVLALDATVVLRTADDSGAEPMRILAVPTGHRGAVLAVAISRDVVDKAGVHAAEQLLVLGAIVLLLVGPGAWWLTRAALRPVERMRAQVADLHTRNAAGSLAVPRTRDEIARLAVTFNGLLARLDSALSRERAFVADAGHELRTPLTVLKGELELARRPGRTREDLVQTVEVAAEETDRLIRLTDDLLLLGSELETSGPRLRAFDMTALAGEAARATTPVAQTRGVHIAVGSAGPIEAIGDPDRIRRAVDNLLTNALRYSPAGGRVSVAVAVDGSDVTVSVTDQGPGFAPDLLAVAFQRFTRAPEARGTPMGGSAGGNGLGLAIVRTVMTAHHGTAVAANLPEGGARVTLRWPGVLAGDVVAPVSGVAASRPSG